MRAFDRYDLDDLEWPWTAALFCVFHRIR